jgi:hypothetical protein
MTAAKVVGLLGIIAVLLSFVMVMPLEAVPINPDLCQNGKCPSDTWNWIAADIIDDGLGTLTMTLTASLDPAGGLKVNRWWFNLDSTIVPDDAVLTLDQISGQNSVDKISSNPPAATTDPFVVTIKQDKFSQGAGGAYDLQFDFKTGQNDDKFDGADVSVFTITCAGCNGLFTASVFDTSATPTRQRVAYVGAEGSPHEGQTFIQPFRTLATLEGAGSGGFIAGVGPTDVQAVPSPISLILLVSGVVGVGVMARRKLTQ